MALSIVIDPPPFVLPASTTLLTRYVDRLDLPSAHPLLCVGSVYQRMSLRLVDSVLDVIPSSVEDVPLSQACLASAVEEMGSTRDPFLFLQGLLTPLPSVFNWRVVFNLGRRVEWDFMQGPLLHAIAQHQALPSLEPSTFRGIGHVLRDDLRRIAAFRLLPLHEATSYGLDLLEFLD